MNGNRKATAKETLEALVEQGKDDEELERVLAMSDEEVDRELEKQGFDLAEVDRDAKALYDKLVAREAPKPPARRRRWVIAAVAAAVAASAAAYAARRPIARLFSHGPRTEVGPENLPPDVAATRIRELAVESCRDKQWSTCEKLLDLADDVDPSSQGDPIEQRARRAIDAARRIDPNQPWFDKEPPRGTPDSKEK